VISPALTISCAFPGSHKPRASRVIISFDEKQSCSSQTVISLGETFASARAVRAACCDIPKPIRLIAERSKSVGLSVARCWPAIWIAWDRK